MGMITTIKNADGTYSTIHLSDKAIDRIAAAIGHPTERKPCCSLGTKLVHPLNARLYDEGAAARITETAQKITQELLERLKQ